MIYFLQVKNAMDLHITLPAYETKRIVEQLFLRGLDALVLDYADCSGTFQVYSIPPLRIDRVRGLWTTSSGKLIMEVQYAYQKVKYAESTLYSTAYWELKATENRMEPLMIKDLLNLERGCLRQTSSGQTFHFYGETPECKTTHSLTSFEYIPKVRDLDSNEEITDVKKISHAFYTINNEFTDDYDNEFTDDSDDEEEILLLALCKDSYRLNGHRKREEEIHFQLSRSHLCKGKTNIHNAQLAFICDRSSRDGSVVAVLVGHWIITQENAPNRWPCSLGIWTRQNSTFVLHPSLQLSTTEEEHNRKDHMGFLHFLSSEHLVVTRMETLEEKKGWLMRCILVQIGLQESTIIGERSMTMWIEQAKWRLETVCVSGDPHHLKVLVLLVQHAFQPIISSRMIQFDLPTFVRSK